MALGMSGDDMMSPWDDDRRVLVLWWLLSLFMLRLLTTALIRRLLLWWGLTSMDSLIERRSSTDIFLTIFRILLSGAEVERDDRDVNGTTDGRDFLVVVVGVLTLWVSKTESLSIGSAQERFRNGILFDRECGCV